MGNRRIRSRENWVAICPANRHFLLSGSGRSVAWLARLFRVQEVVSSNLTAPTISQFRAAGKECLKRRPLTALSCNYIRGPFLVNNFSIFYLIYFQDSVD